MIRALPYIGRFAVKIGKPDAAGLFVVRGDNRAATET
jgi:hypothetical protein